VTRFDIDLLDPLDPFEIDTQLAHLAKHPNLCADDIHDVWAGQTMFYEAEPPADWLMVGAVPGSVLVVPLMKPKSEDVTKARPIGVYEAPAWLDRQYREDRR
jgi:hypothetical protein